MNTLGIDPAARTGLAVVSPTLELLWHRAITPGMTEMDRLAVLVDLRQRYEIGAVTIEAPPNIQDASHSVGKVNQHAGSWATLCRLAGLPEPRLMAPQTWRAKVNMPFVGRSRKTLKRMAVDFARARWGVVLSEDEADAALIAAAGQA